MKLSFMPELLKKYYVQSSFCQAVQQWPIALWHDVSPRPDSKKY